MKLYVTIGAVLFTCGAMFAQNPQSTQSTQPSGTSSGMNMGQKSQSMSGMKDHMQQMHTQIQDMKSRIAKLRSDAEKVQDQNTKAALLDNADMWEQFVDHMQSHMNMMQEMHHPGGMMGSGTMMHKNKKPAGTTGTTPNPK